MVVIIDSVLIIFSVNPSTTLPFKCQHSGKKKGSKIHGDALTSILRPMIRAQKLINLPSTAKSIYSRIIFPLLTQLTARGRLHSITRHTPNTNTHTRILAEFNALTMMAVTVRDISPWGGVCCVRTPRHSGSTVTHTIGQCVCVYLHFIDVTWPVQTPSVMRKVPVWTHASSKLQPHRSSRPPPCSPWSLGPRVPGPANSFNHQLIPQAGQAD